MGAFLPRSRPRGKDASRAYNDLAPPIPPLPPFSTRTSSLSFAVFIALIRSPLLCFYKLFSLYCSVLLYCCVSLYCSGTLVNLRCCFHRSPSILLFLSRILAFRHKLCLALIMVQKKSQNQSKNSSKSVQPTSASTKNARKPPSTIISASTRFKKPSEPVSDATTQRSSSSSGHTSRAELPLSDDQTLLDSSSGDPEAQPARIRRTHLRRVSSPSSSPTPSPDPPVRGTAVLASTQARASEKDRRSRGQSREGDSGNAAANSRQVSTSIYYNYFTIVTNTETSPLPLKSSNGSFSSCARLISSCANRTRLLGLRDKNANVLIMTMSSTMKTKVRVVQRMAKNKTTMWMMSSQAQRQAHALRRQLCATGNSTLLPANFGLIVPLGSTLDGKRILMKIRRMSKTVLKGWVMLFVLIVIK